MSLLNKFKTNSYCVAGRHYGGTVNIKGAITSKGNKMLKVILFYVEGINQ